MDQRRYNPAVHGAALGMSWLTRALGITIKDLFGGYCSGKGFQHDELMVQLRKKLNDDALVNQHSQSSARAPGEESDDETDLLSQGGRDDIPAHASAFESTEITPTDVARRFPTTGHVLHAASAVARGSTTSDMTDDPTSHRESSLRKRTLNEFLEGEPAPTDSKRVDESEFESSDLQHSTDLRGSQESNASSALLDSRRKAFDMMMTESDINTWPGLISTTNNHTRPDSELGED